MNSRYGLIPVLFLALAAITQGFPVDRTGGPAPPRDKGGAAVAFTLTSNAFKTAGDIPDRFTCDGEDLSPALAWTDPPQGTQSFAMIADDPDAPAGTWVHWVIYDIPGETRQLAEGVPKIGEIAGGARQGINDFRRTGYGGPCPPPGRPHRYFFKLYALSSKLNLKPGAGRKEVEKAMQGKVLAQAELMGKFKR